MVMNFDIDSLRMLHPTSIEYVIHLVKYTCKVAMHFFAVNNRLIPFPLLYRHLLLVILYRYVSL